MLKTYMHITLHIPCKEMKNEQKRARCIDRKHHENENGKSELMKLKLS